LKQWIMADEKKNRADKKRNGADKQAGYRKAIGRLQEDYRKVKKITEKLKRTEKEKLMSLIGFSST
jgi:hypothetical protein